MIGEKRKLTREVPNLCKRNKTTRTTADKPSMVTANLETCYHKIDLVAIAHMTAAIIFTEHIAIEGQLLYPEQSSCF